MKSFFMLAFFFSSLVFAQVKPLPPIPPIDIPVSTLCKKQCANNIQYLTYLTIGSQSGTRNCPDRPTMSHTCAPYTCEAAGNICKTACATNADCSAGAMCIGGVCGNVNYYCADFSTAKGTDGSTYDCSPYACQSGQCIKRCAATTDCVGGFVCDIGAGLCVNPTPN